MSTKYVQGAVTSALGYTDSGEAKKEEAVKEMKEAQAQSDSPPAKVRLLLTSFFSIASADRKTAAFPRRESR